MFSWLRSSRCLSSSLLPPNHFEGFIMFPMSMACTLLVMPKLIISKALIAAAVFFTIPAPVLFLHGYCVIASMERLIFLRCPMNVAGARMNLPRGRGTTEEWTRSRVRIMNASKAIKPLHHRQLRHAVAVEDPAFDTTDELGQLSEALGQKRAVEAIAFAWP